MEDPFLRALAESGHQVGELAKHYFPGGLSPQPGVCFRSPTVSSLPMSLEFGHHVGPKRVSRDSDQERPRTCTENTSIPSNY